MTFRPPSLPDGCGTVQPRFSMAMRIVEGRLAKALGLTRTVTASARDHSAGNACAVTIAAVAAAQQNTPTRPTSPNTLSITMWRTVEEIHPEVNSDSAPVAC